MQHIKQNDIRCLPVIREIGCFFRCCGLAAEYKTGKALTAGQINDAWNWAKSAERIRDIERINAGGTLYTDKDCVTDSASIMTRFLRILGDSGRFIEIGTFKNGKTVFYNWVTPEYKKIDALVQKIRQNGPNRTHYRYIDKAGRLIEDPHEPVITAAGIEYSILYHYQAGKK